MGVAIRQAASIMSLRRNSVEPPVPDRGALRADAPVVEGEPHVLEPDGRAGRLRLDLEGDGLVRLDVDVEPVGLDAGHPRLPEERERRRAELEDDLGAAA